MQVDALKTIIQIFEPEKGGGILSNIKVGDVLHAQILGESKDGVILRLSDGTTISASSLINLDVEVGALVEFVVNDKSNGKIFLETIKNGGQTITTANGVSLEQIKDILSSLNFSPNTKNINIAKEMIEREIPINKQNVQLVLNNLAKFPKLDIPKAVFMLANGVSFDEKSINMLNQYTESKIQLGNQIELLVNKIDKFNDVKFLKNIYQKLEEYQNKNTLKGFNDIFNKENNNDVNKNGLVNTNIKSNQPVLTKLQREILPVIKQTILENIENEFKNEQYNLKQLSAESELTTKDIKQLLESELGTKDIKQIILNMKSEEIKALLQKMPIESKNLIEKFIKLEFDKKMETNNVKLSELEINNIEIFKNKIKSHFQKSFISNTSETLKEDLNINETYKDILSKLSILKEVLTTRSENKGVLLNFIEHTEANINFINNLSQYNTYIQLPLNVWEQNTNGELYVLKNSKKKINANDACVFLSLDMPNIGLTEVMLNVYYRDISCNFRVENDKIASLIKKHSLKLIDKLKQMNYNSISINCGLLEKKTNIIDINDALLEDAQTKKLSFDVKV